MKKSIQDTPLLTEAAAEQDDTEITWIDKVRFWLNPLNWTMAPLWAKGLLGVACCALAVGFYLWEPDVSRIRRLRDAGQTAFDMKDYPAAVTAYEELDALTDLGSDDMYNHARALIETGRPARARRYMESLASTACTMQVEALLWVAEDLMKPNDLAGVDVRKAEDCLRMAIQLQPKNLQAYQQLVSLLGRTRRTREALALWDFYPVKLAVDRLKVAVALMRSGQRDSGLREARTLIEQAEADLQKEPENLDTRLAAIEATFITRNFDAAERFLREGLKVHGRDDRLESAWGRVYHNWAQNELRGDPRRALDLFAECLRHHPVLPQTLTTLEEMAQSKSEIGVRARELIMIALARGVDPAALHILLARAVHRAGDVEEAQRHWLAVLDSDPDSVIVLNNLAWSLAWQKEPELDRAMELIDRAVRLRPDLAEIHETRGQILARLGRSEEAVRELRPIVEKLPQNGRLHATLAEVYADMGLTELSTTHDQRAKELNKQVKYERARVIAGPSNASPSAPVQTPNEPNGAPAPASGSPTTNPIPLTDARGQLSGNPVPPANRTIAPSSPTPTAKPLVTGPAFPNVAPSGANVPSSSRVDTTSSN